MTTRPDPPGAVVASFFERFETELRKGLGLAVSGGGDSMALLHLMAPEALARGIPCRAATVDHGLRPEAKAEAMRVANACAGFGVPHEILRWTGWDRRGNLQDAARHARQRLLGNWAARHGLGTVALGHTLDDQAETVLMRLARGSGVDGLSGMAQARREGGLAWLRPLLGLRRDTLRDWLQERGIAWDEDPSNADPRFQRVRARDALAQLEPVGIDAKGLAETAERMAMARAALDHLAGDLSARELRLAGGAVRIDAVALREAPEETRLRLVSAALRWIGGAAYRPRLDSLRRALDQAAAGQWRSLSGVLLGERAGQLWLCREPARVGPDVAPDALWDGRWRLETPPREAGLRLGALGTTGLAHCPDWRETGLPRPALLASPALWRGETLLAAPIAGFGSDSGARIVAEFPYPALPH